MTSKTPNSFTVGKGIAAPWEASALVEVSALYVPILLHRLEVYKLRFPYDTDEEWIDGANLATAQQEALLMDIGDRLISEVRALRNGNETQAEHRDPALDPFSLPLQHLANTTYHIYLNEQAQITTRADLLAKLDEIKAAIEASGGGPEVLEKLDILIALLGVL